MFLLLLVILSISRSAADEVGWKEMINDIIGINGIFIGGIRWCFLLWLMWLFWLLVVMVLTFNNLAHWREARKKRRDDGLGSSRAEGRLLLLLGYCK
jgi:uncharacterized membrane protein